MTSAPAAPGPSQDGAPGTATGSGLTGELRRGRRPGLRPQPDRPGAELRAPHRYQRNGPRLRERVVLFGYRAGTAVLGRLPLRPTAAVGGWFAVLAYWLWPPKRRIVRANAAHVLGVAPSDPAVGRHARAVFRNQVRWIVETLRIGRLAPDEVTSLVDTTDWPLLEAARAEDGSLIVVSAHLGNPEMGAAAIARHGLPIRVLTDDTAHEGLFEAMAAPRRAWGVEMIRWRNLRDVYRVLRAGQVLALLVDWGYRPDGIPVRLFGDWTTLPAGPAILAARTGVPVIVIWVIRRPDGTFTGGLGSPVQVGSTEPAVLARATQAIADDLERGVRLAPEQWTTFKPIWPPDPAEAGRLAALHARQTGVPSG